MRCSPGPRTTTPATRLPARPSTRRSARGTVASARRTTPAAGAVATGAVGVYYAFIQFAGFTIGKAVSQFAAPWNSYPGNNFDALVGGVQHHQRHQPVHLHRAVRQRRVAGPVGAGPDYLHPGWREQPGRRVALTAPATMLARSRRTSSQRSRSTRLGVSSRRRSPRTTTTLPTTAAPS